MLTRAYAMRSFQLLTSGLSLSVPNSSSKPFPQAMGKSPATGELKVWRTSTDNGVSIAEVISQRRTPYPLGKISGTVRRLNEVSNDGLESAGTIAWPYERDLST